MDRSTSTALTVLLAVVLAATLAVATSTRVVMTDRAGIRMAFPDKAGTWQGEVLLYCHNPECRDVVARSETPEDRTCPTCGEPLFEASLDETTFLPADTRIIKSRFQDPEGHDFMVSIVQAGQDRASIHRPQLCLVAQGNEISDSRTLTVDIPGRDPLDITVLDVIFRHTAPDGTMRTTPGFMAYWFVSPDHETPSHLTRMGWMALDRVFKSRIDRWHYISVNGYRDPDSSWVEALASLVAGLYPELTPSS